MTFLQTYFLYLAFILHSSLKRREATFFGRAASPLRAYALASSRRAIRSITFGARRALRALVSAYGGSATIPLAKMHFRYKNLQKMENRNEFWQSQPELLAKTIQTANQNAQLASSSAIIFWHYTATQIKPTKAEIKALETKNDKKTNLPLIIGALAAAMITVFTAWIMLTFYDGFKTVGYFFDALFSTLLIALLMTAVVLPVILLFLVPILYVSDANKMTKHADFDPAKNRTYLLTNEAFFVYLPNKYDKSLDFGLKIPVSDISAIKTNPTNVEIYTNKIAPQVFNMPYAVSQALKKELLKYATDILDANK